MSYAGASPEHQGTETSGHVRDCPRPMTSKQLEDELERLHPASFAWALGCCRRNREEAEEVLQSSYVKVLEGKARFDGHLSFRTFLLCVIRTTAAQSPPRAFLSQPCALLRQ